MKILMRLTFIFVELEKFGPINIGYFRDGAFHQAFPNIIHMFHEEDDVYESCPFDDEGKIDMKNISYSDRHLYEISEKLWILGVRPNEY